MVEHELWWNITFGARRPKEEDDFLWKTTFVGRRPTEEDYLWWKITFSGRRPSAEHDLWWKTTFGGRQPLEDLACCLLHFAAFFFVPMGLFSQIVFFENIECF